jgi:hypothetical protein
MSGMRRRCDRRDHPEIKGERVHGFTHRRGDGFPVRAQRQRASKPLEADVVVGEDHRMFGREVPVERSLGHPDIGGDLGNAGSVYAVGDEALHRRLLQRLTGALATRFHGVSTHQMSPLTQICQV